MSLVLRMGVQGPLYQDNSNATQQLQGTIIIQKHFIHTSVLNYIFLFSKILGILFCAVPWEMKIKKKVFESN
jgi:hypothetical protein